MHVHIKCPQCGVTHYRSVKQINAVVKRSQKWTCKRCSVVARNKENSKPVGSVRIHSKTGYLEEKTESGRWRRQHILVMERHIGRGLVLGEVVHHKDENKKNNDIENLVLMTNGEHTRLHNTGSHMSEKTRIAISNANSKYSMEQARNLRRLIQLGKTQREASEIVGISKMAASRMVRNLTYKEDRHGFGE